MSIRKTYAVPPTHLNSSPLTKKETTFRQTRELLANAVDATKPLDLSGVRTTRSANGQFGFYSHFLNANAISLQKIRAAIVTTAWQGVTQTHNSKKSDPSKIITTPIPSVSTRAHKPEQAKNPRLLRHRDGGPQRAFHV
jgi:hypothetical protein